MAVLTLPEQPNQGRAMATVDSVLGLACRVHSLLSPVLGLAYKVSYSCPLSPVHWDSCLQLGRGWGAHACHMCPGTCPQAWEQMLLDAKSARWQHSEML